MTLNRCVVKTTEENAGEWLDAVNAELARLDKKDAQGNPIQFAKNAPTSPAWLFALANGAQLSYWQQKLKMAYSALNISSCSDEQVVVLATLAGVTRKAGQPTALTVTLKNNTTVNYTVIKGAKFKDAALGKIWTTTSEVRVPGKGQQDVSNTAQVAMILDIAGAIEITVGTTLEAENNPGLVDGVVEYCDVGSEIETISSLRTRLMQGAGANSALQHAMDDIAALPGIKRCTIYFNQNSVTDEIYYDEDGNELKLSPRHTLTVIDGIDLQSRIASVYYSWLNVPSQNFEDFTTEVNTTQVGQTQLPVYYRQAKSQHVDIKIQVEANSGVEDWQGGVVNLLVGKSGSLQIGEKLTAHTVNEWLNNNNYVTVVGALVKNKNEADFKAIASPYIFNYFIWDSADIVFEAL